MLRGEDFARVLFMAHADFLQAAFDSIDALGGLERYLQKTVGIGSDQRAAVLKALVA